MIHIRPRRTPMLILLFFVSLAQAGEKQAPPVTMNATNTTCLNLETPKKGGLTPVEWTGIGFSIFSGVLGFRYRSTYRVSASLSRKEEAMAERTVHPRGLSWERCLQCPHLCERKRKFANPRRYTLQLSGLVRPQNSSLRRCIPLVQARELVSNSES